MILRILRFAAVGGFKAKDEAMSDERNEEQSGPIDLGQASVETKGFIGMLADLDQTPRQQVGISDD